MALPFACPRCDRHPLDETDSGLRCSGCKVDFPRLSGIDCLFAEPGSSLGEWRGRLHFALRSLENEERSYRAALEADPDSPLTRQRLEQMAQATADHAERLRSVLAPLDVDALTAATETYLALRTRLPADEGLTSYYGNIHRDWCWGQEENEASIDMVLAALNNEAKGRTLVLGAGAGRLAYDLHQRTTAEVTVALDFNPLLMLIAQRLSAGESMELYEFPIAAIDLAHQAVLRRLQAEGPSRPGLSFCLADVHRPPFTNQSFDTVVTPWLVDILPERFDSFCGRVNRLLVDGGRWINFGSLNFHHSDPALRLSPEECIEKIETQGFGSPELAEREIPYMCSPASRHGRIEKVLAWSAAKQHRIKKLARHESLPDWLVRGKEPVPQLEHFRMQAMSTRIHAFIMSLIDGRRSIADMSRLFEEQGLMTRAEAEPTIRSFIIKMYEDGQRRGLY